MHKRTRTEKDIQMVKSSGMMKAEEILWTNWNQKLIVCLLPGFLNTHIESGYWRNSGRARMVNHEAVYHRREPVICNRDYPQTIGDNHAMGARKPTVLSVGSWQKEMFCYQKSVTTYIIHKPTMRRYYLHLKNGTIATGYINESENILKNYGVESNNDPPEIWIESV